MLMGVERIGQIPIWNLPSLCLTQLAHPNLPLKHICTDNRNKYSFRFDPAIGSAAFPTWLMKIWCASNIYSRPKEGSKYWLVDIQQFAKYWCTKKENTCDSSETDGLIGERSLSNAQTSLLETVEEKVFTTRRSLQELEKWRLQEVPCIQEQDLCLTPSSRLAVSTLVAGFDPMVLLIAGSSKTSVTEGALQHYCNAARWLGLIWFCKKCGKTSTIMKCYLNDCVMWRWSGYGLRQNQ